MKPLRPVDMLPTIYCTRTHDVIDIATALTGPGSIAAKLERFKDEYGPDLIALTYWEAALRHEQAFMTEPTEISEYRFMELLNVLPPLAWHATDTGESFKLSEMVTGRIATICVRLNERFFEFQDVVGTPHADCCARVAASPAFLNRSATL